MTLALYPGFSTAFEELVSVLARQVESEETWPLLDWIAREMHAASAEEIAELLDRASAEIIAAVPDYQRRRVLSHLDTMRANARDTVAVGRLAHGEADGVVDALHSMLAVVDPSVVTHLESTGALARRLASQLSLDATAVRDIGIVGRVLDVGHVLPSNRASEAQLEGGTMESIRAHCVAGERVLERIPALARFARWVRMHHERLDGSGYPDGLYEAAIPIEVRVLTVADVFVAMTESRSYRPAHAPGVALKYLDDRSGTAFDRRVVTALKRLLSTKGGTRAGDPAAA